MFEFKVTASDGAARVGEFSTPHGVVETPCFMPVGTHGAVKMVSASELVEVGSQVVLANTYHLYLRPGEQLVEKLGGLHRFTGWQGTMLTDSGGFQVFSLGERGMSGGAKQALRMVAEEGVTFQSHLDGSRHLLTPEKSVEIQQALGADIIMAFDQPVYGLTGEVAAGEAMRRSQRWLERSKARWQAGRSDQALFGIVQGGTHTALHRESAEHLVAQDLPGNAIGGLSVGEGKPEMWAAVESINEILPAAKPRYFMGLGHPLDLVEASLRGIDLYDCVAPSRLGRHGAVWVPVGEGRAMEAFWAGDTEAWLRTGEALHFERWNLGNARFADDTEPLRAGSPDGLSRGTLHHFVKEGEALGFRIFTLHNIRLLHLVTEHLRKAIRMGSMDKWCALLVD